MKNIYLILILVTAINANSQKKPFEGKVVYKLEVKNPNPNIVPDSIWDARVKDRISYQKYYYKKSRYKSITDKKAIQIYDPKEKSLINYSIENDTSYVNTLPADKSIDPVKSIKREDTDVKILGYKCKKLIVKGKLTETTYYYSPDLEIPSKNFKGHNYGNWYQYLKETNALPLKIITKSSFVFMEMTATEVIPMKLKNSEFEIELE